MRDMGVPADRDPLRDADFDSGWIMVNSQVLKIRHNLGTKHFKFVTIQGSNDVYGRFPGWSFNNGDGGHFLQSIDKNIVVLGTNREGTMMNDPSVNWGKSNARYIKIKIWV